MESHIEILAYYVNGILYIIALFTIFFGLIKIKKIGFYSIFVILTAASLFQMIAASLIFKNHEIVEKNLKVQMTIQLYMLIEFAIITYYFYFKIQSSKLRKWIIITNGSLLAFMLINFIINYNFVTKYYAVIVSIEAILILICCIFNFLQLFDDDNNISLLNSPDFIFTSGIFFFFSFTCPYYILANYLKRNIVFYENLSMLNEIVYMILFLSFIIGFLCKIRTNKSY